MQKPIVIETNINSGRKILEFCSYQNDFFSFVRFNLRLQNRRTRWNLCSVVNITVSILLLAILPSVDRYLYAI